MHPGVTLVWRGFSANAGSAVDGGKDRYFPWRDFFCVEPLSKLMARRYRSHGGPSFTARTTTGTGLRTEMEKWLVVLGIWAMCASCAVLFIRGATGRSDKREAAEARESAGQAQAALHE
ncbi:hypothetical protein EN871_10645 [bacterium M00.F.Ca.ET.228.01.1.1]|uniref:hypothetical protein n=1 Tax=Paraburkholderia phenoliruptrix TaxID=252970 RepID=UPI001092F9C5|nr:hypothetical protein [Paraburkholderia phenoliruptrix]TGP45020.1 hypothetical protein EN871_10645 [bacterium M00.F.Ca.ET.228.01.1.1]TGS02903.1 hypothetical protein EN834_10640 [bacterium M00.F.Ca.ET.191.01.1.1]TGU06285.1 hypothetical protein EN798_14720 [bacterium M00.F.Ca.ET.155.01.1.1]MBW0448926.1 hypothetical protein [Paraburkholderia phenoliruptrix]MBW9097903.1 hypothetical protein [Paraburkholderia phenoliruptrix]